MAIDQGTGTRTAELQAERERWVSASVATQPIFVDHAHGARITDVEGREFIDFVGGIGSLNCGHTPAAVVAAVQEQAARYMHQMYSVVQYEGYIETVKRMVACHPGAGPFKGLLLNSGAEAVENAVKIARYATNRDAIICFDQGFHGRTLMGMSLTSKPMPYKKGMGPYAAEIYRSPAPYPYRGVSAEEALEGFRKVLKSQIDPSQVAAVILEPVQGEGGFLPMPSEFIHGVHALCQEHGIIYISDEVQAGMGRTGTPSAIEHHGISPDLATWAKSMRTAARASRYTPAGPSLAPAGLAARSAATRSPAPRRSSRSTRCSTPTSRHTPRRSAMICAPGSTRLHPATRTSARCAVSAPCWRWNWCRIGRRRHRRPRRPPASSRWPVTAA